MNRLYFPHPCFQNEPAQMARMHLPVARKCNIRCCFCNPDAGEACVHGCVPGATKTVMSPEDALAHVRRVRDVRGIPVGIVGIAGPGEPLFNEETFETIRLVRSAFADMHICLSTNGLLLPDLAGRVAALGVETLTVTVNCVTPATALKVYAHVRGAWSEAAMSELLARQRQGIELAVRHGLVVKVNSVLVPDVNERELESVARLARDLGVVIHNVLALVPRPDIPHQQPPSAEQLCQVRSECAQHIPQFARCRHCRADAVIDEAGQFCPEGE